MNPEELAEIGIAVRTIKGYGDTAVAECAIALMWEAARGLARMDRSIRAGGWPRDDGMELTGKTLGLVGFGGIAAEVARIASGGGMRVLAWNRTPRAHPGVAFVGIEYLLAQSDVVSLHLLLTGETRGFLSPVRIAAMKRGAILVNTARANAIVGEALRDGRIGGLDAREVRPEAPFPGGGRADFLLDGQTWVEVKNVTLLEGRRLLFPDTVSERATRHLGELRAAVERGERAVLLLHVGREGGEEVSAAAHIDPVWAETLAGAMDAGLEVQAWRSALDAAGATLVERLPFTSPGR